ncbi:MAG: cbb3-type cytochrome c oxidase subunit I [Candidatus Binatus sp.]|uniref:cytochrome c oxidase subunit I n=1 Tax=Candidatus Binatus sp. TaxID=2811406 RepID=UPI002726717B|nr:cbb3-type cytochrome c oxidase subunit I [Candidatus Binatus sp.]MDO8433363.1 cbb3-type cytochrome c oxidase subunit I [Candidatus Binatus sp.]
MGAAQVRDSHEQPAGFIRRYVFSTDHKVIAKQYLLLSLAMALVGGFTAYLIRWQLAWPETDIPGWGPIGPDNFNAIVTMHGTVMVFFVAMPFLLGAFGNFLIPLMIGARDMAFPRLNLMSFWTLFTASVVLTVSMFVPGGPAAAGWTSYAPLSDNYIYTGVTWGQDLWILAVALEFASFLMGGINFLTTTLNLRAPGMTLFRLPLLVWMEITAAVVFLLSVGPLIAGALMLLMDRKLGTSFFRPDGGGDPLLWEHLFWFFGHPEVYVVALPGFGIMLEVIPVFARKPIFGYRAMIWSTIAAGLLSFVVWAHHMFVSGMDPRLATSFSVTTILISVPFAIIVFAMIATVWRGSIDLATPMLFALGGLATFLIGGVTGIFVGSATTDIFLHGTYFVVAHFHYTLFPVTFFGGFAGIYYWYPKFFGRMMNETLGKIHFYLTLVCFNAVFIPLFLAGLQGNPRRIYEMSSYDFLKPVQPMHLIATIATIGLLLGQLPFVINFGYSLVRGKKAVANPWQANTLEWMTDSPPPHENFRTVPIVCRDPYEYSVPGASRDWIPQTEPEPAVLATAAAE